MKRICILSFSLMLVAGMAQAGNVPFKWFKNCIRPVVSRNGWAIPSDLPAR